MRLRFAPWLLAPLTAGALHAQAPTLDSLDAFVRSQMARRHIRGLSLAIVQDGRIAVARGYGITDDSSRAPVTITTLFQAGSISKPISALGALHLVEAGRLSLDADVNQTLRSWKVPENPFTRSEKVTLRRVLSHNAGLTVHGFPGYDVAEPVPTLVQVLDGAAPANTPPIRVDTLPGAIWRYSGGGFTVMQQLMIDVTGMPFPRFMQEAVLGPIGMSNSSFEQPQPPARAARTAAGYYASQSPVRGRWHVYPELAAAGLWTTATDLARAVIEIQETLAGKGHRVISPLMARQYLTEQKDGSGLGIGVSGSGAALSFSHGGRDEGFDAQLSGFAQSGQGAAIMINANDNSRFMGRLLRYISRAWRWPDAAAADSPAVTRAAPIAPGRVAAYAGYYELAENQMIALVPDPTGTGIETLRDGLPDEAFLAVDSVTFGSTERQLRIVALLNGTGAPLGVVWQPIGRLGRRVARVAPLPSSVRPMVDPDAGLTARIDSVLGALQQGGAVVAGAAGITAGAKRDFSGGRDPALEGLGALSYLGEETVVGRGIRRHGHEVARVRYYRVTTKAGPGYLLVHVTAEGLVTDYDVVSR